MYLYKVDKLFTNVIKNTNNYKYKQLQGRNNYWHENI